jgi:glycosyltransferase involved in cell wall biosynthesis
MTGTSRLQMSILIPVFNWDLSLLLPSLVAEIDQFRLGGKLEVIVIDDHSSDGSLRSRNETLLAGLAKPYLRHSMLERNLGRAAIRNLLAAEASGEFLLFLDCDVLPDAPDFIRSYLSFAESGAFDVVSGGISYRTRVLEGREFDYHAYLGGRKEVKAAAVRNREPWRHILTSNIMVRKSVFQATPFDERFTGYGYEDVEWGARLAEKFKILHLDNTASHLGLVTKARSHEKMCNSVSNYLLLKSLRPEAFHASSISKVVRLLESVPAPLLAGMDRLLKKLFLYSGSNRFAFLFFQLDFAVLLASARRSRQPDVPYPKPSQGRKP